ncbi:hypothetical protein AB0M12_14385 [Nocardia vinacea]|uniref:hypothetical protein n=1 Tax=Nocardia vinacea TaxID=96468 RepID=UPI00343D7D24
MFSGTDTAAWSLTTPADLTYDGAVRVPRRVLPTCSITLANMYRMWVFTVAMLPPPTSPPTEHR